MRVLVVHNKYRESGGEDSVVANEIALLRRFGITVEQYERSNDEISAMSSIAVAASAIWSRRAYDDAIAAIRRFRPDVIHAHNTFPLISPSVAFAANHGRVPIVQTLHNFRMICPQAMFLRNASVCEDCVGRAPWRGVVRACYRNSISQSAVVGGMISVHRALGTFSKRISRFIALNAFCRDKFIESGFPAEKISIKPNFVDLPVPSERPRRGVLFVGRLSPEKGIDVLIDVSRIRDAHAPIEVVGDGPERMRMVGERLNLVGRLDAATVFERMRSAEYLIVPSISYETFGLVVLEAFANATPVIASRIGAVPELVKEGSTGLLFDPGDSEDLAAKMAWADAHPREMRQMGLNARVAYEERFTPSANFQELSGIYSDVIRRNQW